MSIFSFQVFYIELAELNLLTRILGLFGNGFNMAWPLIVIVTYYNIKVIFICRVDVLWPTKSLTMK